ncbi:MAG TPA: hypothetical protein VHK65_14950 [Candidatus Dormibacteraeota bacterium]|nr:hypothetical protein [Candidatus Dormibacteraeota bacterium]
MMATTTRIQEHPFQLPHLLAIVVVALALVLGFLAIDALTSIGLVTRTVAVETETFHVVAKYTPLKLVAPSPRAHAAN